VTNVDWVALGLVGLAALMGWRKGLIAGALSLAGVVAGAVLGARVAPHLLSGGERSPYTPLVALAGAFLLASVLEGALGMVGSAIRRTMRIPPLRALDSAGGFLLGATAGLAIVWVVGAAALQLPGQTRLRHGAQESTVLRELNALVPPRDVLRMLARVDPFPTIAGPEAPVQSGDPALLRSPGVRRAAPSVVRVLGTACGLSVAGSGWVARDGVVVTAAHVVAGQSDTHVVAGSGGGSMRATAIAYDPRNDVAVLRVPELRARPLRLAEPTSGVAVGILGYPENGPFTARAGRLGRTTRVVSRDAYGKGPTLRTMTAIRGDIRHGNSGGPAVDGSGAVVATVFAAKVGGGAGYGVPTDVVRETLAAATHEVDTGDCTG
jgi:S1-C subfamily serine protease